MSRIVNCPNRIILNNNGPIILPALNALKQDMKNRVFSPVILFHEYTDTSEGSCVRISQDDEHYAEFIKKEKKRVDEMLYINSQYWLVISANSREQEKRLFYGREIVNYQRPMLSPTPSQLANTIYSHHPQDQLEGLAIKQHKRRRGNLPKATTALLKEWLTEHKKHPYPTEEEKLNLAKETKLTLQQISNWFINARRRHLPHILESDYVGNKVSGSSQTSSHELDIFTYEASDNSAEDSDNNGLMRRASKCSARINKTGGIKKPYIRKRKTSSV